MRRSESSAGEPIFPTPPRSPRDIEVKLLRKLDLQAGPRHEIATDAILELGGFGEAFSRDGVPPEIEIAEDSWLPDRESEKIGDMNQLGTWRQEVAFRSTLIFTCPPSFVSETLSVGVRIASKVFLERADV